MLVGVPKEIKNHEYRVGLTPSGVSQLIKLGHEVIAETDCGAAIGFYNQDYLEAGAQIVQSAEEVFSRSELIVKVKEPQPHECKWLSDGQILFTYLHLAADPVQTDLLVESGASAIAYETIEDEQGLLPLLTPMSEIAGRLSVQAGMRCLEKAQHGRGLLLSGVAGVAPANVCIIGGGVVGKSAARLASVLGANTTILDTHIPQLRALEAEFFGTVNTLFSTHSSLETAVAEADLVIGAVLIPGDSAPKLVSRAMLAKMKKGAVLVDVAIDQGGCFETSHATSHDNPSYVVDDVVHYCVANMPGAVPLTATQALTNATLPYVLKLANQGLDALRFEPGFFTGLNIHQGQICYEPVARALNKPYKAAEL